MPEPDAKTFSEPSSRSTIVEWTPELIRSAEAMASQGDLRLAAELCDWLIGDGKVQGDLKIRTGTLLGLPITFEPGSGRRKGAAIKALEGGDWIASYPEVDVKQLLNWGALLGVGLAQNLWVERDGRVIPRIKVWHPRFLRQDLQRRWLLRVASKSGTGETEIQITPGDGTWWLYTPEGSSQPWMHGAWRAIARWVLLKSYTVPDWGNASGRNAGTYVGDAPPGAKKEDRRAFAEDLADVGRDAAIVPPPGYKLALLQSTAKNDTYERQVEVANREITYTLHGHNMTSEQGGSFAKAIALNGVRLQVLASDSEGFATATHDGGLTWYCEFNGFGGKESAPWARYEAKPPEDLEAKGKAYEALGRGAQALTDAGVPIDTAILAEQHGIPVRVVEAEDDQAKGQLYKYHFDFGIITINEARARLGLPAIPGGDVPAKLIQQPGDGEDGGTSKNETNDDTVDTSDDEDGQDDDADEKDDDASDKGEDGASDEERALSPDQIAQIVSAPIVRAKRKPKPFVEGQLYTDAVADVAREHAARALRPSLDEILALIEKAESYQDLRTRLVKAYPKLDPKGLASVMEKAMLMTEMAGRASVQAEQDS